MAKSKTKSKSSPTIPTGLPTSLKHIKGPPDIRTISVIIEGTSPYIPGNFRQ
jgi:hypothetical protein